MNPMNDLTMGAAKGYTWLLPEALMEPHHLTHPAPWAGHIPFAAWLVAATRPNVFVELGAYSGISYLAFCQAITQQRRHLKAQRFAATGWHQHQRIATIGHMAHDGLLLATERAVAKDMLQDYQCLCPGTHIEFDIKRSGAMMAWNHFHPNQEPRCCFSIFKTKTYGIGRCPTPKPSCAI